MNDGSQDLNARTSLCWKCKHGMCVNEEENQTIFGDGQDQQGSQDSIFQEDESEVSPGELFTQFITAKRVQAICYWHPKLEASTHPIRVAHVTQCSRFKDNDSEKKTS